MFKTKKYWKNRCELQQENINTLNAIVTQDVNKICDLRKTINILTANKIKLIAKISKLEAKIKELEGNDKIK